MNKQSEHYWYIFGYSEVTAGTPNTSRCRTTSHNAANTLDRHEQRPATMLPSRDDCLKLLHVSKSRETFRARATYRTVERSNPALTVSHIFSTKLLQIMPLFFVEMAGCEFN